jgi:CHAD domain-containing protein
MAARNIPLTDDSILQANIIRLAKDVAQCYTRCIKNVKDKKATHVFRVSLKKIVCVQQIDEMMELKIFNDKTFKEYRHMFKLLGELREWNLLEERYTAFAKQQASMNLIVYFHKKEGKAIKEIKKGADKARDLQRFILANKAAIAQLDYKPFHDYYLQRMQQTIQLLVDAAVKNKRWHRLRKQLKRCIYLAEIISKEPHKAFVELQHLLGKWHDAHMQLVRIERYLNTHNDPSVIAFQKELIRRRKKFTKKVEEYLTTVT